MPDPLAHHPSMLIIRPDSLPRFWWLFPWSVARQLHKNSTALREMADNQSTTITNQANIIGRYMVNNTVLKSQVVQLDQCMKYWRIEAETDHARWLRVLEDNEALRKQIADIDAAIMQGRAITPDAHPHE
jgi:hypothetical protein